MYDIFISYKHTNEFGFQTLDFSLAESIYNHLTKLGYSVFFSNSTLIEEGKSEYKDAIDNALDEVKILIVVSTSIKYVNSPWVKYEWDSFYGDYLSGVRKTANLFTVYKNLDVHKLPRTLRNLQCYQFDKELSKLYETIFSILPPQGQVKEVSTHKEEMDENRFYILRPEEITPEDIQEVLDLEAEVYTEDEQQSFDRCIEFYKINPYIYLFLRDTYTGKIVANIDISPVTDECYELLKSGEFQDKDITPDMLLSYDMPYLYNIYFAGITIKKEYRGTKIFLILFNAVVNLFLELGEREIYAKRMIADAVSSNGEKFCKQFGMEKVKSSDHASSLYEISLLPPKFNITSIPTKKLYSYYKEKYEEIKDFLDGEEI